MTRPNKIAHDAEKIADIVGRTNTEQRGDLLYSVATILKLRAQYYTGAFFEEASARYGRTKT